MYIADKSPCFLACHKPPEEEGGCGYCLIIYGDANERNTVFRRPDEYYDAMHHVIQANTGRSSNAVLMLRHCP